MTVISLKKERRKRQFFNLEWESLLNRDLSLDSEPPPSRKWCVYWLFSLSSFKGSIEFDSKESAALYAKEIKDNPHIKVIRDIRTGTKHRKSDLSLAIPIPA